MTDNVRQSVQREYNQRLAQEEREQEERIRHAGEIDPRIAALLKNRTLAMTTAYADALKEHKLPDRDAIKAEYAAIDLEISQRLAAAGLPPDYLKMQYQCPVCKDRGYVGDADRHDCECFTARIKAEKLKRSRLDMAGDDTFDKFDETIFSDEPIAGTKYSQRDFMRRIREKCEQYCDAFPDNKYPNIVLSGKTGLGKTFLMNCMANKLFAKGVNICYVTAYRMLDAMRDSVLDVDNQAFEMMLDAELLIIDDLGSEPIYKNITLEMLFTLLNERIRSGRHTIIATNLTATQLNDRYMDRVASRLVNLDYTMVLQLVGKDVRMTKRGRGKKGDTDGE